MKFLSLLLLVLAISAHAESTAKISLYFPPMPVDRVGIGLMQAVEEPFWGTITLEDGTVFQVTDASIPATYVRGRGFHKTVDACVGTGDVEGGNIVINLPPEPVRLRNGVMTALAITATVAVTLPDGTVGTGTIFFPDCPTEFLSPGHFLAESVTAIGSVTFP